MSVLFILSIDTLKEFRLKRYNLFISHQLKWRKKKDLADLAILPFWPNA
jgi:hypothetical protein